MTIDSVATSKGTITSQDISGTVGEVDGRRLSWESWKWYVSNIDNTPYPSLLTTSLGISYPNPANF